MRLCWGSTGSMSPTSDRQSLQFAWAWTRHRHASRVTLNAARPRPSLPRSGLVGLLLMHLNGWFTGCVVSTRTRHARVPAVASCAVDGACTSRPSGRRSPHPGAVPPGPRTPRPVRQIGQGSRPGEFVTAASVSPTFTERVICRTIIPTSWVCLSAVVALHLSHMEPTRSRPRGFRCPAVGAPTTRRGRSLARPIAVPS